MKKKALFFVFLSLVFGSLLPFTVVKKIGTEGFAVPLEEEDRKNWPQIYKIMLTYAWPSCLSYLDELTPGEKLELFTPKKTMAEETFINKKLEKEFGPKKYVVSWIPNLILHTLCIKKYVQECGEPCDPTDSIDCSQDFSKNFIWATLSPDYNKQFDNVNKAVEKQCFVAHKIVGTFLKDNGIITEKEVTLNTWTECYTKIRNEIKPLADKKIEKMTPALEQGIISNFERLQGKRLKKNDISSSNFQPSIYPYFVKPWTNGFNFPQDLVREFIAAELQAYQENKSLLFRGTNGTTQNGLFLVDSPRGKHSLSFSNDPLSGCLGETGGGIAAGSYIIKRDLGLAIFVDKRQPAGLSEHTKNYFFISTFNPVADLFAKGHFAHSRTLVTIEPKTEDDNAFGGFFGEGGSVVIDSLMDNDYKGFNSLYILINDFNDYRASFFDYLAENTHIIKQNTLKISESINLIENLKKAITLVN